MNPPTQPLSAQPAGAERFFPGGGDMGARVRAFDWSTTALGPVERWPHSLKTAVRIMLDSRYAMWMAWGPELVFLCNDAYVPTLGLKKHRALGASARDVWAEIWPDIGPRIDSVLATGRATWDEGLLLFLERSGAREETYHTFSYSPLPDDGGAVYGMLCVVTEESDRVVEARRSALLRELGADLARSATEGEVLERFASCLRRDLHDLPFSIAFLAVGERGFEAAAHAGITAPSESLRPSTWPLEVVIDTARLRLVGDLSERLPGAPKGAWDRPPSVAIAVPISQQGGGRPIGVFVAGLNPNRPLDEAFRGFVGLLVGQLAAALGSARTFEAERRRAEQLAQLDRAKTAFFSNVSHEFRTPLTLMLGPTQAALEAPGGVLQGDELQRVHRNQLRLLKLVNSLLDFARIEGGRVQAALRRVDLAAFTADLASIFRSAIERAGMALVVDCKPLPQSVAVDPDMWEKIVLNLLSNAFKYTLQGEIRVSLAIEGGSAVLRVTDTGTGLEASELPRIFERFHRVEGAQGRAHEGTGIGLALVKELVTLHGGDVSVESRFGHGSVFIVSIPLLNPVALAEPPAGETSPTPRGGSFLQDALEWASQGSAVELEYDLDQGAAIGIAASTAADVRERVLVVDDNADMREYLRRLLGGRWGVVTAADGMAALDEVLRSPPALVLTDVMMPRLDGFGLLRELRARPHTAGVPVLLLSARAGEEARIEGLQAGADDYLTKPFAAKELVARIEGLLALARVRREAVQREQALKAETYDVLESIHDGHLALDADWRIRYVNAAAERLVGRSRAELVGADYWTLYATERGSALETHLNEAMHERRAGHFETLYAPKDRWYEVELYPHSSGGLSLYFRDITERKQTVQSLQDADRRKDEFLATLAHELRNPLAPIRNAAEILGLPKLGPEQITWTRQVIRRQVHHMSRLLDDLLDLSRISRGRLELHWEAVRLGDAVDAAVEACRPLIESRGHALTVDAPQRDRIVQADLVRLTQVMSNLLNNAAKYTDRGGAIRLACHAADDGVTIVVEDNGIGMTADQLSKAFEMFSQFSAQAHTSHGGLGIGLALVRGIADLHGGRIEAESAGAGRGCRFSVSLPLHAPAANDDRAAAATEGDGDTALSVLVVDDNQDAADSLGQLLSMLGHRADVVHSGEAALRAVHGGMPDLVLLDIAMPGMTGHELARRLRAMPGGEAIRLVAVSGWGSATDHAASREAGFDAHLVKPVALEHLTPHLAATAVR